MIHPLKTSATSGPFITAATKKLFTLRQDKEMSQFFISHFKLIGRTRACNMKSGRLSRNPTPFLLCQPMMGIDKPLLIA